MLPIDCDQRLLHLSHLLGTTSIERLLHDRLFGTGCAAKGVLQDRNTAQPGVDLDEAMGAGQDTDEGVVELVEWRMLHGFLSNRNCVANRSKQIDLVPMLAQGGQAGRG